MLVVLLAAAALAAGFAAGYAVAGRPAAGGARRPSQAVTESGGPAVSPATAECSAQTGRQLQLGMQVSNGSRAPVTLRRVTAVLPLGGLRPVAQSWQPCGALEAGAPGGNVLAPGASGWFTVTFRVLVRCPGPDPVQFRLRYAQRGQTAVQFLDAFPDLSQVPYSGCPGG